MKPIPITMDSLLVWKDQSGNGNHRPIPYKTVEAIFGVKQAEIYKLIEALKDAHPFVTDDELRISIGKLVAEVEGL